MMSLQEEILQYGQRARLAARLLAQLNAGQKNAALLAMADEIMAARTLSWQRTKRTLRRRGATGFPAL